MSMFVTGFFCYSMIPFNGIFPGERAAVRTLKALANWIGEDEGRDVLGSATDPFATDPFGLPK